LARVLHFLPSSRALGCVACAADSSHYDVQLLTKCRHSLVEYRLQLLPVSAVCDQRQWL
jgi:hypothetical protein